MISRPTVSGVTRSYVRDGVDITSGSLRVRVGLDDPLTIPDDPIAARYQASATSEVVSVGGLASLVLVNADAIVSGTADAFIGAPTGIAAGGAAGTDLSITGPITVVTLSKMYAIASADGTGGGAVTVGVMLPTADVAGTARAYIGAGADVVSSSLMVSANAVEWRADATTVSVGIGGVSGQGADANANVSGTVDAHIGTQAGAPAIATTVNTGSGAVSVLATSVMRAYALADGAAFGLAGAVAIMHPTATVNGTTRAYVGDGGTVNAGKLTIIANASDMYAEATTDADQIGLFGAGSGLVATATVSGLVEAFIGAQAASISSISPGTVNVGSGAVVVESGSSMSAYAKADSTNGSLLAALAVIFPDANVTGTTRAYVRDGVDITAGSLRVRVGLDDPTTMADDPVRTTYSATVDSLVIAISGVVGGTLIDADAEVTGVAEAFIGAPSGIAAGGAAGTDLQITNAVDVEALSTMTADANANGTGATGGVSVTVMRPRADVAGTTRAYIGAGADVFAGSVDIDADGAYTATADTVAVAVAGLAAGIGATANAIVSGLVDAHIGTAANATPGSTLTVVNTGSGAVTVDARSSMSATPTVTAIAVAGGVSISDLTMFATISGKTRAYVGEGTDLDAGSLSVAADAPTMNATANLQTVNVAGLGSGSVLKSTATVSGEVEAFIGAHRDDNARSVTTDIDVNNARSRSTPTPTCARSRRPTAAGSRPWSRSASCCRTAIVSGRTGAYVRDGV